MFETWDALVSTLAAFLASGCGNDCRWLTERADGSLARLTVRGREEVPKLFNPVLRLLGKLGGKPGGLVNKAFGNMVYEKTMSEYKEEYRTVDFVTSIEKTEK